MSFRPSFVPSVTDLKFMVDPPMRRSCGTIAFANPSKREAKERIVAQGSYGLVNTGRKRLLVTCHHVWDEFQSLQRKEPGLRLWLCVYPGTRIVELDPIEPIDEDKEVDLATFDADPLVKELGNSEFSPLCYSSLPRIKEGEPIAFIGFPGRIEANNSLGFQFRRVPYVSFAYQVTPRQIVANFSKMKGPMEGQSLGGISGAPGYAVRRNRAVELVGFAKEVVFNQLRFTLASFVNSDGTIKKL